MQIIPDKWTKILSGSNKITKIFIRYEILLFRSKSYVKMINVINEFMNREGT